VKAIFSGLLAVGILGSCSLGGPPYNEDRELPGAAFDENPARVREAVRDVLKSEGFVLEREAEGVFASLQAQGQGFTWRLRVVVHSELGTTFVTPRLEIHRESSFRPWRSLGQNSSGAAIDDARLEGGNYSAYGHDREMIQGEDDRAAREREQRIDEVSRRASAFLSRLEKELGRAR
jgi:hypothetical protein